MIKNKDKEVVRGFSLVEIAVTIAIMAVLTAMLIPAILHYVEKSRMKKDEAAMSEVVKATNMTLSDDKALREWINHALKDNLSCYLDVKSEGSLPDNKIGLTGNNKYRFDDESRIADEMAYYIGGNIDGVLITFEPNNSEFVISDALVNKYAKGGPTATLDDDKLVTAKDIISGMVGDKIQLKSRAYKNSEFTVFIQMDLDGSAHVVGEFNGTNIDPGSSTVPTDERKDNLPFEPFVPDIDFDVDPDHKHNWKIREKVDSTCTEKGHITKHCFECGETKTEELDLLPHNFESGYQHDSDRHWLECSVCGKKEHVANHDSKLEKNKINPTCTENGYVDLYCSVCHVLIKQGVELKPLGHEYPEKWTKANNTYHEKICSRCGQSTQEKHISDGVIHPVIGQADYECNHCEKCGAEMNIVLKEKWSDPVYKWSPEKPNGQQATCTAVIKSNRNNKEEKVSVIVDPVVTDPLCETNGKYVYKANFAGTKAEKWSGADQQIKVITINALGHDWSEWQYKDKATHERECKRKDCDGKDHGYEIEQHMSDGETHDVKGHPNQQCNHCTKCGAEINIKEKEVWGKIEYKWDFPEDQNKNVTCTAIRRSSWQNVEKVVVVASRKQIDATCTKEGSKTYTADFKSSEARTWEGIQNTTKIITIGAKGHNFTGKWIKQDEDTHIQHCSRCDEVKTERHISDENTYPVFGRESTHTCNHCTKCGAEINIVEKWGSPTYKWNFDNSDDVTCTVTRSTILTHKNEQSVTIKADLIGTKEASCLTNGSNTYKADFSNSLAENWDGISKQEKTITVKALGHDFTAPWENKDANLHWHKCSRCEVTEEKQHVTDGKWVSRSDDNKYECQHCKDCGAEINIREKWGNVTYTWNPEIPNGNENSITCTATRRTEATGKEEKVTIVAPRTQHTEPQCTVKGESTYEANFIDSDARDWAGISKETITVPIDELGHQWPDQWIYLDDNFHYRQCMRCPEREEKNHVSDNISHPVIGKENTHTCNHCTECKKEINIRENWTYEYEWTPKNATGLEDELECTVKRYRALSHEDTEMFTIKAAKVKHTESTCTAFGSTTYEAKFSESIDVNDWAGIEDQTKTVQVEKKPHTYERKFDQSNHWDECSVCHEKINVKEHVWPTIEQTIYKKKIMVDGTVYAETEKINKEHDGIISGKTTSHVDGKEIPKVNDQSNFGNEHTSYSYTKRDGYVEVKIKGDWIIFEKYDGVDIKETQKDWHATNKDHHLECKDCGFVVGPEAHNFKVDFEWEKDEEGNYTQTCVAKRVCTDDSHLNEGCGYREVEVVEVHNGELIKAPTCVEDGQYKYVANFNSEWAKKEGPQEIILPLSKRGHRWTETKVLSPKDDTQHAYVCLNCLETREDAPHNYEIVERNNKTHTIRCVECGHQFDELQHNLQITYTWDGTVCTATIKCIGDEKTSFVCDYQEEFKVDAKDNWKIVKNPTADEDGIIEYTAVFEGVCDWDGIKNQTMQVPLEMPIIDKTLLETELKNESVTIIFSNEKAPEVTDGSLNQDNTVVYEYVGNEVVIYSVYGNGVRAPMDSSKLFAGFAANAFDINGLVTKRVTDMSSMFANTAASEIIGLETMDTSSATTMASMFSNASMKEINVSSFDTTNVTNMESMFAETKTNKPLETIVGLENLKTDKVLNMSAMFQGTSNVLSINISGWNTGRVQSMNSMFLGSGVRTIQGIETIDVSSVVYMNSMFSDTGLDTLDLSQWDTKKLAEMKGMFESSSLLMQLNISNMKTGSVTSMEKVFNSCENLKVINGISDLDTHNVTNMNKMFSGCDMIKELNLATNGNKWNVTNVTSMAHMFDQCRALRTLNVTGWDTKNVKSFEFTFARCEALGGITGIGDIDTNSATTLRAMFYNNRTAKTIDVSNFNTTNVTEIESMFDSCENLTNIVGLDKMNTSNITNMACLFKSMSSIETIDLTKFDTSNVTNMQGMFQDTSKLKVIDMSMSNISKKADITNMFARSGANALDTVWCNLENINKLKKEGTNKNRGNHAPEVFKLKEIWGDPIYQWDDKTKVCTATKPCITFQERTIKVQGVSAKETIVNATCTSKGTDRYTATFPGYDWAETQIKDYETPMSPHKVNEAVFESDDTHHWNVCSECKQAINKTEHSVNISEFKHDENSHWNECSICHKKVNQKAHTWSEWEYDENTHQYHCNECGVVKGPESHIWSDVTYSWAGLKCTATRKCVGDHFGSKGCGYIQTETVDAEKNATIEKDSTCTKKGVTKYTADFTAAWANTQSKSITNIPVKEHNWSKNWISDKEQHWHECSECHQKQDAAQHNIVEDTKTKPGYIIKKCSVCGTIISEDPVVMNKMRFHTACQSLTGKITFSKDSAPSGGKDISEKQDGTVLLFIDGQNATIYSKDGGGVFAPTDRKLFQDMNMSELDLSGLNTSQITDMLGMFWSCQNLTTLDLSNLDTSNVTDMSYMFIFCSNIKVLDMSNFNTSKVTTMRNMFQGCSGLTSLNVSSFDTTNVTDMSNMFFNCRGLTSLNISNFNTSKTKDMGGMFQKCSGLTSLDVTNFNTSNVIDMSYMFKVCNGLTSLDLSSFDTSKVVDSKNMDEMLSDCNALTTVKCRTQEDIKKIKASKTCPKTINFIL